MNPDRKMFHRAFHPDRKTFLTHRKIIVVGAFASFLLFVLRALLWPSSGEEEMFKSPAYWAMAFAGMVFVLFVVITTMNALYAWAKKSEIDSGVAKGKEENAAAVGDTNEAN